MEDTILSWKTRIGRISGLRKPQKEFLTHMLALFLSIKGRINFLQLARHTQQYGESTCRLQFEEYVDFPALNQEYILQKSSRHLVLAFDLSYLPKSGKATSGVGKYWSGSHQMPMWGLEAGLLSVIDIDHHTAFHLDAIQTPDKAEREAKQIDLADHSTQAILWCCPAIQALSAYIALDGYFAKKEIITRLQAHLQVISRLRSHANCAYLYQGPPSAGKGAPRKYAGKINWQAPDLSYFTLHYQDQTLRVYDAKVYCRFLKQTIRVAYCQSIKELGKVSQYKIYFSTDLNLPAFMILKYYQARFQQEFLIRDAKQFTGLNDCQARSINKLEYHWNLALTAVNLAKAEHWLNKPKDQRGAFSMSSSKTLYHNHLLIEQLFDNLPKSVQMMKNDPNIKQLYAFGAIAA
jgi:hypothetical protein